MKRLPESYVGIGELENLWPDLEPEESFILVAKGLEEIVSGVFPHQFVYDFGEPSVSYVAEIKEQMPEDCRVLVALGGGSVLDTAKLLKMEFSTAEELEDILQGRRRMKIGDLIFVAVPTTCGTGSEATSIAIVENLEGDLKKGLVDDEFLPDQIILDASLLKTLPDRAFCYAAVDALVHAVESFISVNADTFSRRISRNSITAILENFTAARNKDEAALEQLLYASFMAGYAFNSAGVGAVHALAYPLGAELHIPHGLANGMLLKEVLEFQLDKNTPQNAELKKLLENFWGEEFSAKMETFLKDNLIEAKLSDYQVTDEDLQRFAQNAFGIERLLKNSSRKFENPEQINKIYKKIF